jgi:hypothetical protein
LGQTGRHTVDHTHGRPGDLMPAEVEGHREKATARCDEEHMPRLDIDGMQSIRRDERGRIGLEVEEEHALSARKEHSRSIR